MSSKKNQATGTFVFPMACDVVCIVEVECERSIVLFANAISTHAIEVCTRGATKDWKV